MSDRCCKVCGGSGFVWQYSGSRHNMPTESGHGHYVPCPECGGTGDASDFDEEATDDV